MFLAALLALTFPTPPPEEPEVYNPHGEYVIFPGSGFDGVVRIDVNPTAQGAEKYCTGSLLRSGRHILTAAQCLQGDGKTIPQLNIVFDVLVDVESDTMQETGIPVREYRTVESVCVPNPATGDRNLQGYCVSAQNPNLVTFLYRSPIETAEIIDNAERLPEPPPLEELLKGDDIAILQLTEVAPATAERYALYRRSGERGQRFLRVGYGATGSGATGEQPRNPDIPLLKRLGANRYDAHLEEMQAAAIAPVSSQGLPSLFPAESGHINEIDVGTPSPCLPARPLPAHHNIPARLVLENSISGGFPAADNYKTLVYDFDNGTCQLDALGRLFGLYDVGLLNHVPDADSLYRPTPNVTEDSRVEGVLDPLDPALRFLLDPRLRTRPEQQRPAGRVIPLFLESGWGKGDEGSPAFIHGQIAGIASRRVSTPGIDAKEGTNGSFGEYFVDVRVSAYADFIDAVFANADLDLQNPAPDQR